MKNMQRRFLTASVFHEGLPFFGTALSAAIGYAAAVGLVSAAKVVPDPAALSPYARTGAALSILFALAGALQSCAGARENVQRQTKSIGMRKALGFTPGEILRHHRLMSLLCALSSLAMGLIMSVCLVQLPVIALLSPGAQPGLSLGAALSGAAVILALFLATAQLSCSGIIRRPANELMRDTSASGTARSAFQASDAYERMSIRRRMALMSVAAPATLFPALLGAALPGAALSLSFSLQNVLLALCGAGLSLLMLLTTALSQVASHKRRQAKIVSIMRACGYTKAEARSFALTGILALLGAGLALGFVAGALLAALL